MLVQETNQAHLIRLRVDQPDRMKQLNLNLIKEKSTVVSFDILEHPPIFPPIAETGQFKHALTPIKPCLEKNTHTHMNTSEYVACGRSDVTQYINKQAAWRPRELSAVLNAMMELPARPQPGRKTHRRNAWRQSVSWEHSSSSPQPPKGRK